MSAACISSNFAKSDIARIADAREMDVRGKPLRLHDFRDGDGIVTRAAARETGHAAGNYARNAGQSRADFGELFFRRLGAGDQLHHVSELTGRERRFDISVLHVGDTDRGDPHHLL